MAYRPANTLKNQLGGPSPPPGQPVFMNPAQFSQNIPAPPPGPPAVSSQASDPTSQAPPSSQGVPDQPSSSQVQQGTSMMGYRPANYPNQDPYAYDDGGAMDQVQHLQDAGQMYGGQQEWDSTSYDYYSYYNGYGYVEQAQYAQRPFIGDQQQAPNDPNKGFHQDHGQNGVKQVYQVSEDSGNPLPPPPLANGQQKIEQQKVDSNQNFEGNYLQQPPSTVPGFQQNYNQLPPTDGTQEPFQPPPLPAQNYPPQGYERGIQASSPPGSNADQGSKPPGGFDHGVQVPTPSDPSYPDQQGFFSGHRESSVRPQASITPQASLPSRTLEQERVGVQDQEQRQGMDHQANRNHATGPPDLVTPVDQGPPASLPPLPNIQPGPFVNPAMLPNGNLGGVPDVTAVAGSAKEDVPLHEREPSQPSVSHAEHYAYYQQFEHPAVFAEQPAQEAPAVEGEAAALPSIPNGSFGTGPDVTAVSQPTAPSQDQEEQPGIEISQARPSSSASSPSHQNINQHQGSHEEHYAYYQQFENQEEQLRPPDILSSEPVIPAVPNSDRNLFMQTGEFNDQERQPVDGGNEQEESAAAGLPVAIGGVDIPLDRLVLGESEQNPSPTVNPPPALLPPPPPPGGNRIVAGGTAVDNQQRIVTGYNQQSVSPPATASQAAAQVSPPVQPQPKEPIHERSEAVGSDRRDETVMGPPPPTGPAPPTGRRDVTGQADTSTKTRQRKRNESDYSDEDPRNSRKGRVKHYDDDRISDSTESGLTRRDKRRGNNRRRRKDESPEEPSFDEESEEDHPRGDRRRRRDRQYDRREDFETSRRYKKDRYRDYDRRDKRAGSYYHNRSQYPDDSANESIHNQSVSSKRNYRAGSYRGSRYEREDSYYHNDSRPSSRAGDYRDYQQPYSQYPGYPPQVRGYPGYYPHMQQPMMHPQMHQVQPDTLDEEKLNLFRKNWEYYSKNPKEMENLQAKNPQKHSMLMRYYQMYHHLLPVTSKEPERPSRCASHASAQSSVGGTGTNASATVSLLNTDGTATGEGVTFSSATHDQILEKEIRPKSAQGGRLGDQSTIYPDPNAADPYQPTLIGSKAFGGDQSPHPSYDPEVIGITENIEGVEAQPAYDPNMRITPMKFSVPHVKAVFSSIGILAKIDAKSPLDGQTATVEFHTLQGLMAGQKEYSELKDFPGPLVPGRTHKGEVIQFCQSKIQEARNKPSLIDRDSYILIWDLLILLLRQKNTIDGSDIAELLLRGRKDVNLPYNGGAEEGCEETESSTRTSQERSIIISSSIEDQEKHTIKFRDYLLFGHKKEGLEFAMKHGLWGHALFLASKMDERSYSTVMLRFANGLAVNDPLQTLYQSMSGRQPIAVKECADATWGDWRPHLAMILSNPTSKDGHDARSIRTLGDTLTEKGFIYAGQFCYLMANQDFGTFHSSAKLVLLLGDRGQPFDAFCTNEAVQATEVLEYAQKLSNPEHSMVALQYFKYLYCIRLFDHGFSNEAYHYLEELSECIIKRPQDYVGDVGMNGTTMVNEILTLAEQMKYLDPMYTTRDGERAEMGDPQWLVNLRNAVLHINTSGYEIYEPTNVTNDYNQIDANYDPNYVWDPSTNQYVYRGTLPTVPEETVSAPLLEMETDTTDHYHQPKQPQAKEEPHLEPHPEQADGIVEESPPQVPMVPMFIPQEPLPQVPMGMPATSAEPHDSASSSGPSSPSRNPLEPPSFPPMSQHPPSLPPMGQPPSLPLIPQPSSPPIPKPVGKHPDGAVPTSKLSEKKPEKEKKAESNIKGDVGSTKQRNQGIFGRFFNIFKPPNQMILPDDKDNTIVWDEDKKMWVDKNADPNEKIAPPPPPPAMKPSSGSGGPQAGGPPGGPPGGNKFTGGLGKRRGLSGRVDVFKSSKSAPALAPPGPPTVELTPIIPEANGTPNVMIPASSEEQSSQEPQSEASQAPPQDRSPVFFNPNQFQGGQVAPTRRNKYT